MRYSKGTVFRFHLDEVTYTDWEVFHCEISHDQYFIKLVNLNNVTHVSLGEISIISEEDIKRDVEEGYTTILSEKNIEIET